MSAWLGEHGLACRRVAGPGGAPVALMCEVPGGRPGPRFVLDACLDTAPFGDETAWTYPPASGQIAGGWLHGRGSADSKAGAAIFAHIAAQLRDTPGGFGGSVVLLFDVDEHTGGFGSAKAYFEHAGPVDGVMIGYPGLNHVVTGGQGVVRARVRVHGIAGHSGSTRAGAGAIAKAAHLIRAQLLDGSDGLKDYAPLTVPGKAEPYSQPRRVFSCVID
jgi:succinyl-diaminopimelate desuccinylase